MSGAGGSGPRVVVVDAGVGNLGNVARALAHLGAAPEISRDPARVAAARCLLLPGVGAFAPPREALRGPLEAALAAALADGAWLLGICVGFQLLFEAGEEFGVTDGLGLLPGRVRRLPAGVPVPHIGWNRLHDLADHSLLAGLNAGPVGTDPVPSGLRAAPVAGDHPLPAGPLAGPAGTDHPLSASLNAGPVGTDQPLPVGLNAGSVGADHPLRAGLNAGPAGADHPLPAGLNAGPMGADHPLPAADPPAGPDRRGRHFYFVHSYAPEEVPAEVCLARATHGRSFTAVAARGRVMGTQFHPERSGAAGLRLLANFLELAHGSAAGH